MNYVILKMQAYLGTGCQKRHRTEDRYHQKDVAEHVLEEADRTLSPDAAVTDGVR